MAEQHQMSFDPANILPKMSLKTIGCKPKEVATAESGRLQLARVYGLADGSRFVADDKSVTGSYTFFTGTFEAVNLQDGEIYRSSKLFLPGGISEMFEKEVAKAKKDDPNAELQFAFEIRAKRDTNPIGYSYEAQALRKIETNDPLAAIRGAMLALPAGGPTVPSGKPKQLEGTAKTR